MSDLCVLCEKSQGRDFYGFLICESCQSKLRLFDDKTIQRYILEYDNNRDFSFEDEMDRRLKILEKDYIKKKVKLLYIKNRIEKL